MIVLGPLIVISVLLIGLVLAGKLLYAPDPVYIAPDQPVLRIAVASAPVFFGGEVVAWIEPGDSLWIVRAGDGSTVVFADSLGSRAVGISRVVLDVTETRTTPGY